MDHSPRAESYRMVKALRHIISAVFLTVATVTGVSAQPVADTMPGSMDEHIRTLRSQVAGADMFAPPVIVLGSGDVIYFSFDHLADDRAYFRYRLVHCNANWQPSGLVDSEIIDGFNEYKIDDYAFSRGTTVNYVNYRFTVPAPGMKPLISGNYLVQVYDENNPDRTVAQWRFMVSEQSAAIAASASSRTDIDYNKGHQQMAVAVTTERETVADPFNDLTVMIQQNGRLDNETALRHPLRQSGRTVIYEHLAPLIFEAGNEYRRFETVTIDFPGMNVDRIEYIDPYYHAALMTDTSRSKDPYLYDSTQQGRFLVRDIDSDDHDCEADYVVVHFSLAAPDDPSSMIFIDGDLTDRRFDENSRMVFNPSTGLYERAMLLKQGSYNYQYLTVPPGKRRGFTAQLEGDNYQTVNEYLIKVYARQPGERYDRLIGVSRILTDR